MDLDLHAFSEELTKTIDEFDGQISEFELDPKSAVLKSEGFVLKLRRVISNTFSRENKSKSKSNENSFASDFEIEGDDAGAEVGNNLTRKSPRACQCQLASVKSLKNSRERLPKGPGISKERAQEIEKADQHLRSIQTETSGGFCTLYKCLLCGKVLNVKGNARIHVLRIHFKMGTRCQKCPRHFFNPERLRRHMTKCSRALAERKMINVKSSSGGRAVKAHVYSQSKQLKSCGSGFSHDSNETDKDFDPKNSNANVKVRNPFDDFSLKKKATSAKIKKSHLKLNKNKSPNKTSPNPEKKENEEEEASKKSECKDKKKKRTKTAPSKHQNAKHDKPRVFDVEGAQLICGIERSFYV